MKSITITEYSQELVFDIQNKAYITGRSREAEGTKNYEASSNMQASNDPEDLYQLKRSLSNAFTSLKSLLGEYIDETGTTDDNKIRTQIDSLTSIDLNFLVPDNFRESAVGAMGSCVHEYLVNYALYEWFMITNKVDADTYLKLADGSLAKIKRALYRRLRPNRPTI